jgi:hypothetical protein
MVVGLLALFPPSFKWRSTDARSGESASNPVQEFSQNTGRIPFFLFRTHTAAAGLTEISFGIKFPMLARRKSVARSGVARVSLDGRPQ